MTWPSTPPQRPAGPADDSAGPVQDDRRSFVSTSSGRCLPVQRVNAPRISVGDTNSSPVYSRKVWSVVQHPGMLAGIVGAEAGDVGALRNTGSALSASAP